MPSANALRRARLASVAMIGLALGAPAPAAAGITGPLVPIEGVDAKPHGEQPVPPPKPDLAGSFETSCQPPDPEATWNALPRTLRELPLRAMIGQLLVVSYSGTNPDSAGVKVAAQALRRSEIGGVLTFRHNIESAEATRAVNNLFADANPVLPALIGIDQEGGAVRRVKESEGAPNTPSAEDVAKGSLEEAYETYREMAENLADLGFTVNFGPVVDLAVNPTNPVIARYGRSFGAAPEDVVGYAETFIEAHEAAGVATSLKHFPGHGSSRADSHSGAIDLTPTWRREELVPFAELIGRHIVDMVMIGHLELAGISGPGDLPASLSPIAIDGFLRNTLCFDGLVISDDLAMDAIEDRWGSAEAARLMIAAGGDLALISLPTGKGMEIIAAITDRLEEEAEASPRFADKIRHAYARVATRKLELGNPPPRDDAEEEPAIAADAPAKAAPPTASAPAPPQASDTAQAEPAPTETRVRLGAN